MSRKAADGRMRAQYEAFVEYERRKLMASMHTPESILHSIGQLPPLTQKEGNMTIEVGKIVTRQAHERMNYDGHYAPEESVRVSMTSSGISVILPGGTSVDLTSKQAIELGQLLLKTAELQPEWALQHIKLVEEQTKLAARYKDMVSGLGLDTDVDVTDARGTFTVIERGVH